MIEMKVAGIALDAVSRHPIVLLRDATERRQLPIYIGQDQARAIISALENQTPPRPLTHDLMVNLMEEVVADASMPVDRDADEAERKAFRDFLSNLRPDDFKQGGRFSKRDES